MKREQNVGTTDRWIRMVGGALAALGGLILLLSGAGSLLLDLAYALLILLGLDFLVTGLRGYCPLYQRLGWSTARSHQHPASVR